jgi:hypothetical protein
LLFAWGTARLLPVATVALDIVETLFDAGRRTQHARVALELEEHGTPRRLAVTRARLCAAARCCARRACGAGFAPSAAALDRVFG